MQQQQDELGRFLDTVEGIGGSDGEEEFRFSRNYFLSKEAGGIGKKSGKKISDVDLVDEQELRDALLALVPKHVNEQAALMESYKSFYSKWLFQLRLYLLLLKSYGIK